MLGFAPTASEITSIDLQFRKSFYEYRIAVVQNENLRDVQQETYHRNQRMCIACPRGSEPGIIYSAIDGMFRCGRRKKAGKHSVSEQHLSYVVTNPSVTRAYLEEHNATHETGTKRRCTPKKNPAQSAQGKKTTKKRTVKGAPRNEDASNQVKNALPKPCPDRFRAGDTIRSRSRLDILDETGAMVEMCARHEFVRSVSNIYHGERFEYADLEMTKLLKFINEDYTSTGEDTLEHRRRVILFYDVNCQYLPHIRNVSPHVDPWNQITAVVNAWHSACHSEECQLQYHPSRIPGCGLCEGEAAERLWSKLGDFHTLVKEMLASTRQEQIEDFVLHFNNLKIHGLGVSLAGKYKSALNGLLFTKEILHHILSEKHSDGEEETQLTIEFAASLARQDREGKPIFSWQAAGKNKINLDDDGEDQSPLVLQLKSFRGQIRELAVFRWNVIRLKRSKRFVGGQRNTQALYQQIKKTDKSIVSLVEKYNDTIEELMSCGNDEFKPVTTKNVLWFKSPFWLGTNISAEKLRSRRIVDYYCKMERHLEEIWLLEDDSSRFKEHLKQDAELLLDYLGHVDQLYICGDLELDDYSRKGLKAAVSVQLGTIYDLHNKHSLPDAAQYAVPSRDLGLSGAIRKLYGLELQSSDISEFPDFQENDKLNESSHGIYLSSIRDESTRFEEDDMAEPNEGSDSELGLEDVMSECVLEDQDAKTDGLSLPIDQDRALNMAIWKERIGSPTRWLSSECMIRAFEIMHSAAPPGAFFPPIFRIDRFLENAKWSTATKKKFGASRASLVNFLNFTDKHWVTVKCEHDPVNRVLVYDSANDGSPTEIPQGIVDGFSRFFAGESFKMEHVLDVQQQRDACNCGVFSILYAQCLFRGEDPAAYIWKSDMGEIRRELLWGMLKGNIPLLGRRELK